MNRHRSWLYCCRTVRSSHWRCSIKKLTPTQVLPVDVAKVFRLAILKNICEWLLLDCFNGLLFRLKGSTFILCDSVKLQGLSHRSSFLFISWHFWSWTDSHCVFENLRQNLDCFRLFWLVPHLVSTYVTLMWELFMLHCFFKLKIEKLYYKKWKKHFVSIWCIWKHVKLTLPRNFPLTK